MLPTEELFVYVYVLIDDVIIDRGDGDSGAARDRLRLAPMPSCWRSRRSGTCSGGAARAGFLAEIARDWGHLFPALPGQSEVNRRTRWLGGAFEYLRGSAGARVPEDDCQQVDTSALPVKHPSRVRGADGWTGPGNDLAARFGRDAAHAEWFYGFRLAVKTDLGSRIVRAWAIVPGRRQRARRGHGPAGGRLAPRDLLADKGFNGAAFAAALAACGTAVLVPPEKKRPRGHGLRPAEDDRRMAKPHRDDLQRDHRPDGTGQPRRAHLLGPADQDRSHHRRPHTATASA